MRLLVATPRGFCAGVQRAIDIVDLALKRFSAPIFVRKEIVHNKKVVEDFTRRGVIFIEELSEAPTGSTVIFSAHGISPDVRADALQRGLKTIDATCPLVTKVHLEVHRFIREGYALILIGHKDHDEVIGTMGEAPGKIHLVESTDDIGRLPLRKDDKIMVLTQTTLSVDETQTLLKDIQAAFPKAILPPKDDICYATQNRQDAVKHLLNKGIDVLLVVGSKNSSNSQRLCEVAKEKGIDSYLIDGAEEIDRAWFQNKNAIGLTAGASAPEYLVQNVISFFQSNFHTQAEEVFDREENVTFSLPKELTLSEADKTTLSPT